MLLTWLLDAKSLKNVKLKLCFGIPLSKLNWVIHCKQWKSISVALSHFRRLWCIHGWIAISPTPLQWPSGHHRIISYWYKSALLQLFGQNLLIHITELSSDHLSAKLIYFPLKMGPFPFQFMGPLNLSTTCFNTTHIMWNGCPLEQCTLPAFLWCKAQLCKWVPEFVSHLGWKSVPSHEIITLIFT